MGGGGDHFKIQFLAVCWCRPIADVGTYSHAKQRATQPGTHRRGSERRRRRVPPVFRRGADDDVTQICLPGGMRSLSRGVRRRRVEICIFSVADGTSKEGMWKV